MRIEEMACAALIAMDPEFTKPISVIGVLAIIGVPEYRVEDVIALAVFLPIVQKSAIVDGQRMFYVAPDPCYDRSSIEWPPTSVTNR